MRGCGGVVREAAAEDITPSPTARGITSQRTPGPPSNAITTAPRASTEVLRAALSSVEGDTEGPMIAPHVEAAHTRPATTQPPPPAWGPSNPAEAPADYIAPPDLEDDAFGLPPLAPTRS